MLVDILGNVEKIIYSFKPRKVEGILVHDASFQK